MEDIAQLERLVGRLANSQPAYLQSGQGAVRSNPGALYGADESAAMGAEVVARMVEVHPQTLRLYERQGLIKPQRRGQIRMFSDADIDRLRQIQRLKDDLGVNIAGIEVILNLLDRIEELQQEIERIRAQAKRRLQRMSQDR